MTCDVTTEDFAKALTQLLPPGPAMQFEGAVTIPALLLAIAESFKTANDRTCDLLREIIPTSTVEMLSDWERDLGLPEDCFDSDQTFDARRAAVVSKLGRLGGQSPQYYIDLAASIGFEISVVQYDAMRAGRACGQALTNDSDGVAPYGWTFVWTVRAETQSLFAFKAGLGRAGEPLRYWGNTEIECLLNKWKPAHTQILFDYGDLNYA